MRRPREEAERADGIARIGNKMQERLEVTAFPVRGNIVDFFERGVEGERERRGGGRGQPARGVENRSARGRGRDGCPCRRAAAAAARVARASERARENRTVGVGNRGGGGGGGGDGFFQSSNLLNLFFPRNVAAVSKLLIAIRGEVEEEVEEEGFAGASEGGCAAERFRYMWGRV